jgi:hypothetical protein
MAHTGYGVEEESDEILYLHTGSPNINTRR